MWMWMWYDDSTDNNFVSRYKWACLGEILQTQDLQDTGLLVFTVEFGDRNLDLATQQVACE